MKTYYIISLIVFCILTSVAISLRFVILKKRQQTQQNVRIEHVIENPTVVANNVKKRIHNDLNLSCVRPPCDDGYIAKRNSKGELCCYIDPKSTKLSKKELYMQLGEQLAQDFVVGMMAEKVLYEVIKKIVAKRAGKTAATKIGTRIATKITNAAVKGAVRSSSRIAAKSAVYAAKLSTMAAKAAMGPVGWAMLVFDVLSFGLDIWDPAGYNKWVSNALFKNVRNQAEVNFEETYRNENIRYPVLAPYMYDESKIDEFMKDLFSLPDVMDYQTELFINAVFETYGDPSDPGYKDPTDQQLDNLIDPILDDVFNKIEKGYFDKAMCNHMARNGKSVKWVKGVGCSLNQQGCREFNRYQKKLPDDKRSYAMYTNEYRVRDTQNPGDNKKPNVKTRFLNERVCMLSPLEQNDITCVEECKGCEWNVDAGMCDFGKNHCKRFGLKRYALEDTGKHTIHNCKAYPGQKLAELVFGTTITRSFIRAGVEVEEALYLDKLRGVTNKLFPAFGPHTPISVAEDLVFKTGEMVVHIGKEATMLTLKMGGESVDNVHKMINDPRNIDKDMIIYAITLGPRYIAGMYKAVGGGVVKFTKGIIRDYKNFDFKVFIPGYNAYQLGKAIFR